ncbi:MAG TPA: hypothetical protein EYH06_10725 [Chromatiales bacterium]|nr:hypothetical protein [Thiotrichales bacterium]HIP69042.1 hypothetical protein [Chromatiales bacterium]
MKAKNLLIATTLGLALSFAAFAGPQGMHGKGGGKMDMHTMMNNMQTEMETIINTEDSTKRKAMFAAHKGKMHEKMAMMEKMGGNCSPQKATRVEEKIDHHGEDD